MNRNFILSAFADEIDTNLDIQIDSVKKLGIDHIEVRGVNGKGLTEYEISEVKEIARVFKDEGIGVSSLASPFGKIKITDDFAPHLEDVKKGLEIANIMGTKRVRLFSFYIPEGDSYEQYTDEVMKRMDAMSVECKKAGILCCHENEKGIYGDIPERCLEIINNIDGIVGIFDPANFVQCGVDTIKAWEMLKDKINYLHIKDAKRENNVVVPSGKGEGNIAFIANEYLKSDVPEKIITLEPHLTIFSGLDKLESGETIQHEFTFDNPFEAFKTATEAFLSLV